MQITGYRSSFTFTDAENTISELAGADFPWRTGKLKSSKQKIYLCCAVFCSFFPIFPCNMLLLGLAPLNTFRVSQIALRRSHFKPFKRTTLPDVCDGLISIIQEYQKLPLWEGTCFK